MGDREKKEVVWDSPAHLFSLPEDCQDGAEGMKLRLFKPPQEREMVRAH